MNQFLHCGRRRPSSAVSLSVPLLLGLARAFGLYAIVQERRCHVYVLFGKVMATIDEPGLHFLCSSDRAGGALVIHWLGRCHVLDMRLDQEYLRSQPVNSEEGAPMGIGIWYEMFISDPVAYLFKNTDPRGSLAANVSNSTVRCLSNCRWPSMLVNRHAMSHTVRDEVSPKSHEWGYKLGSVYIRKVHFRDAGHDQADREQGRQPPAPGDLRHQAGRREPGEHHHQHRRAAGRHRVRQGRRPCARRSSARRLQKISQDADVASALFDVLEAQKIIDGEARITILPQNSHLLGELLAANSGREHSAPSAPVPTRERIPSAE